MEGSYAAISLGGNPFPIPTGETVFCRGGQVDGYLHTIRVALYDTSTDPSEPEPVWVTPIIGSEDKHCLYSDLVWGEYRATSDSLRFTNWEAGGAIYDAAWTSFPEAFRAIAPDDVAAFQRTAEAPPAYYLDLR